MKKFFPYILILVIVGILIPTKTTYAAGVVSWLMGGVAEIFPSASDLVGGIILHVGNVILILLSFFLWLSGQLLNFTLDYTIIDLKSNLDKLTGINTAWKVIRDLMNIAFIFMLIYEGIMLIIGRGSTQQLKKFIIGVVLASILINFSLFFTKVLIDASNIVTIGFYNAILGPNANTTDGLGIQYGLSNPIVRNLNLTSIYDASAAEVLQSGEGASGASVRVIGSGIIILITTFIFFAVAIMFIVRYVALIILLMLSPVAYMGIGLPFMQTYSGQWWTAFKSQLLFAPIYMILTWVALTLMASANFVGSGRFTDVFNNATKPEFSTMGLILNFAVVIGLLLFSLIVAKSTATKGSGLIGQATGKLSAFAGGAVFGGTSRLGRNTLGRWGASAANNEDLKSRAAAGSKIARMQLAAANKAATSSFDTRASKTFGTIAGTAGMKDAFGKVDSKKENFRAQMEERDKEETKRAERYKTSDLAVQQAKAKLKNDTEDGKKFEAEEAKRKAEHDRYLNSEEYKNSEQGKKDAEILKVKEDYEKADAEKLVLVKKIEELEKRRNSPMADNALRAQVDDEISQINKDIVIKDQGIKDLKKAYEEKAEAIKKLELDREQWMSEEKKSIIAIAGGTTKDKKGVIRDANNNMVNVEVKSAYQQRMDAEANRVENRSALWRFTANTLGAATNVIGITSTPRTKTDRKILAMKLRKQAGGKNAKDKIMDAVKEMADAEKEPTETTAPKEPTPTSPDKPNTAGGENKAT